MYIHFGERPFLSLVTTIIIILIIIAAALPATVLFSDSFLGDVPSPISVGSGREAGESGAQANCGSVWYWEGGIVVLCLERANLCCIHTYIYMYMYIIHYTVYYTSYLRAFCVFPLIVLFTSGISRLGRASINIIEGKEGRKATKQGQIIFIKKRDF